MWLLIFYLFFCEIAASSAFVNSKKLCWRAEWVHPHESVLSIIEKIKIANQIESIDIIRTLGIDIVRDQKSITQSPKYLDLYTMYGFDNETFNHFVNFSIQGQRDFIKKVCKSSYTRNKPLDHFSKYLNYCEECLHYNFHSILHQLLFISRCPYHDEIIRNTCVECKQVILYSFRYGCHFQCSWCGYILTKDSSWDNWNKKFEIKKDHFNRSIFNLETK